MPRITNVEMFARPEQPTLVIKVRTSVDKLPQLIGQSYGQLAAYLQSLGEEIAGVPFVAYHNMDMQDLDLEIGFPVLKKLPNQGNIIASAIAAGRFISAFHLGPYNEIEPTYEDMGTWIEEKGLQPTGIAYEYYYNDLNVPPEHLLTEVVMSLK